MVSSLGINTALESTAEALTHNFRLDTLQGSDTFSMNVVPYMIVHECCRIVRQQNNIKGTLSAAIYPRKHPYRRLLILIHCRSLPIKYNTYNKYQTRALPPTAAPLFDKGPSSSAPTFVRWSFFGPRKMTDG